MATLAVEMNIENNTLPSNSRGIYLVIILSMALLVFFFHPVLFQMNSVFFSLAGDGLQVYYNTIFYIKHSPDVWSQYGMHYPYSESVFFTGSMPAISIFVKLFGLSNYAVGIMNLSMLMSFPLSAVFLYFIFREYKVQWIFGSIAAVCIAFLSPQLNRLTGHYNLAFSFAVPGAIYLMIKFLSAYQWKYSIRISLYLFLLSSFHLYLFMLAAIIISFAWLSVLFQNPVRKSLKLFFTQFPIQIVLPYICVQLLIYCYSSSTNRTSYPWGFFDYYSNLSGILYSPDKFYSPLLEYFNLKQEVNYEGVAYVGFSAVLFLLFVTGRFIFLALKGGIVYAIKSFSTMFWVMTILSVFCLLLAFCIPFKDDKYRQLVPQLLLLKQFRALGRFTWEFYYVLNVVMIIAINNLSLTPKFLFVKRAVMIVTLIFLSYDMYCHCRPLADHLKNNNTMLSDWENQLPESAWINHVKPEEFQAVLSLPYFHQGSENHHIYIPDGIFNNSCIVSLKTGLPMFAVYNSRVPIDQSYKSIQLFKEPYGEVPPVFSDFKSQKDVLIVCNPGKCKGVENKILDYASLIAEINPEFKLYRLKVENWKKYYVEYTRKEYEAIKQKTLVVVNDSLERDNGSYIYTSCSASKNKEDYLDGGTCKYKANAYSLIFESPMPFATKEYSLSFWVKNMDQDLYPRTNIDIKLRKADGSVKSVNYTGFNFNMLQFYKGWGLSEYNFSLEDSTDKVEVIIWNNDLSKNDSIEINNVLLRKADVTVINHQKKYTVVNNRIFVNILGMKN